MPHAIVAVKPASSASGASSVTRYIAESKRNPEKEQLKLGEARPLFSSQLDNLNYHQANEIIGQSFDSQAQANEVIHLVISLEPDQFEALGDSIEDRKTAFQEIVRETAKEIQKGVGTKELDWVAGIHLNTDNPHVHLAISREGVEADSPRFKRIDHLPRTLLPHREQVDGQSVLKEGLIAEAVTTNLTRAIEHHREYKQRRTLESEREPSQRTFESEGPRSTPVTQQHASPDREVRTSSPSTPSQPNVPREPPAYITREQQDREVLGRAMVVAGEVERLDKEVSSLIEHGDKRRFRVFDASHGRTRQISQFDVHRRAEARAGAAVRNLEILDPNERHEQRTQRYKAEVITHDKALHDHQIILNKTINKTNKDLTAALNEHALLQGQVRAIAHDYAQEGKPRPTPFLTRAELSKLQNQAISNSNPTRVKTLENTRESLVTEHDSETRNDQEIARLEGQLLVARVEQAARAVRLRQFQETKHQTSWQIGNEKYSLVYVDRLIEENENASKLFRTPLNLATLFFPSARRAAAATAAQLREIRITILDKIDERRDELHKSLNESAKMTETLSAIFALERTKQLDRQGERLEKELTRSELSRLVDHSLALGDPAMLRQALLLESQYNRRQEPNPTNVVEQAARSAGRSVITAIAVKESQIRLEQFSERRDFVPVVVQDLSGKDTTLRIADLREPYHPIKWAVHRLMEGKESRHLRNEVHRTLDQTEAQLKQDVLNFRECHQIARSDTLERQAEVLLSNQPIPDATFTTRHISQLELYAVRHQDPNERDRIFQLINHAELSHRVFTPVKLDNTKTDPTLSPVQSEQSLDSIHRSAGTADTQSLSDNLARTSEPTPTSPEPEIGEDLLH